MTNFRTTALATLLALGTAAGAAQAQSFTEPNLTFEAARSTGSVVGGGVASVFGGGDEMVLSHSGRGPVQAGRIARVFSDAGEVQIEYLDPATVGQGRPATMIGGGDNTMAQFGLARPGRS